MTSPEAVALIALVGGGILLVALNTALQRLARPDQGTHRIAGCCGTVVPSEITTPHEDLT